jgi:hypothetical protein
MGLSFASADGLIVSGYDAESAAPGFSLIMQALGNRLELQSQTLSPASQWMIDIFAEEEDDDDDQPPLSLVPP